VHLSGRYIYPVIALPGFARARTVRTYDANSTRPLPLQLCEPAVGLFWFVDDGIIAAGKPLRIADRYSDNLTYDGGHAEHWDRWKKAGSAWLKREGLPLSILSSEYDDHPRGRVIYLPVDHEFRIYADVRLQTEDAVRQIRNRFALGSSKAAVLRDSHYR
jgi:hypothetical protein